MTSFHRPRFTDDEIDTLLEAVNYHYLTDLYGYGVSFDDLTETEAETHTQMVAMRSRLLKLTASHEL